MNLVTAIVAGLLAATGTVPVGFQHAGNVVAYDCRDTTVCPFDYPNPLPAATVSLRGGGLKASTNAAYPGDVVVLKGDFSKGVKNLKIGCIGTGRGHSHRNQDCRAVHSYAVLDAHTIVFRVPTYYGNPRRIGSPHPLVVKGAHGGQKAGNFTILEPA